MCVCVVQALAAAAPRCEIHVFDPTTQCEIGGKRSCARVSKEGSRWHYHNYGIGGANLSDSSYWTGPDRRDRGTCLGCAMRTIHDAMASLNHTYIDVLKVDVDGAEWRAFEAFFTHHAESDTLPFAQLQIETTGPDFTSANLGRVARFFQTLAAKGFRAFRLEANYHTCRWDQKRAPSIEYAFVNTRALPNLAAADEPSYIH